MRLEVDIATIIKTAIEYEVDQYDILESFVCNILNIKPEELYPYIKMYQALEKHYQKGE